MSANKCYYSSAADLIKAGYIKIIRKFVLLFKQLILPKYMKQIRNTHAKTEILNIINGSEVALSHADIQRKIGDLCNRVTIYRVLERLEKEGNIHKITNVDGVVNFAKCNNICHTDHHSHDHVHFNCENCKTVLCIENITPAIQLPKNFTVRNYNLVISGICPKCQNL